MARPAIHHCGSSVSSPGICAPYRPRNEAATSGSNDGGDQVTADQSRHARDQRQRYQLDHQHRVEQARGYAAGAQRPQHRQALLEGEPDRRIDDEQADHERQQAERGQVQMEAVGEAFEIALRIGCDQPEPVAGDRFERRALAFGFPINSRETRSGIFSSR